MATDPQMLSDWYQSYTAKNPAQPDTGQAPAPATSLTGTPAPPAPQTTGMLQTPAVPQATAQVWKPDANSTVQGQLKNVLDAGGPLMDRATTRAAQQVNQRGLLNSSLGITAGQTALYDAATPIATNDASMFASAGKTNAELGTQTSISNSGLQSQQALQEAGFKQQTSLQDADFAQQTKTQAADLASRYDLANLDVASRERLQQADIANQQKLQAANATLQAGLQASDLAVKQSMQQYEAALKQSMQGLDNENRLKLAQLDADNRTALAKIEAEYKNQLQANSSMATSYQSMVDSFTRVMLDPNMDAGAKQAANDNLTTLYNNTLKMQSDVSGLKLGELLAPGALTGSAPAPAPAPVAPGLLELHQHPVDGGGP